MKKVVFITGASNGIGKGLSLEFASRGYDLALCARNEDALQLLADEITQKNPAIQVNIYPLDVTDIPEVARTIKQAANDLSGIDIVIANAGIAGGGSAGSGKLGEDINIIQTNVIGAIATIDAAVSIFKEANNTGHVVAISSVAAFRGLPGSGAYSASKAAVHTYMQSVNTETLGTNIKTTTLYPGFIDTDLNRSLKSRPFLVSVDQASPMMVDLIEKQVVRSTVPVYPWAVVARLLSVLPSRLLKMK